MSGYGDTEPLGRERPSRIPVGMVCLGWKEPTGGLGPTATWPEEMVFKARVAKFADDQESPITLNPLGVP